MAPQTAQRENSGGGRSRTTVPPREPLIQICLRESKKKRCLKFLQIDLQLEGLGYTKH